MNFLKEGQEFLTIYQRELEAQTEIESLTPSIVSKGEDDFLST